MPADILVKIDSLFSKRLGIFTNKAKFSYGQIVDLDQYFKSNKDISGMQWVVPKYDLFFILTDTTIGIKNYYLQVRLDQYGQILRMNWPMQYYTSAKKFADRKQVEQFALRRAREKIFLTTRYEVEFIYDYNVEAFYWRFLFPKTTENNFDCIEINWADFDDIRYITIIK